MSEQPTEESQDEQPYTGPVTQSYGGGCPKCGQSDGLRNIGSSHWDSCDKHKTKWWIGADMFSGWHEETPEIWEKNAQVLADYTQVKPIYPPPDQEWVDPRSPAVQEADDLFWDYYHAAEKWDVKTRELFRDRVLRSFNDPEWGDLREDFPHLFKDSAEQPVTGETNSAS